MPFNAGKHSAAKHRKIRFTEEHNSGLNDYIRIVKFSIGHDSIGGTIKGFVLTLNERQVVIGQKDATDYRALFNIIAQNKVFDCAAYGGNDRIGHETA